MLTPFRSYGLLLDLKDLRGNVELDRELTGDEERPFPDFRKCLKNTANTGWRCR